MIAPPEQAMSCCGGHCALIGRVYRGDTVISYEARSYGGFPPGLGRWDATLVTLCGARMMGPQRHVSRPAIESPIIDRKARR